LSFKSPSTGHLHFACIGRANKLIDGCRSEMEMPLQLAEFSGVRMA